MPADALAPKVARPSAGMVLAVYDKYVALFQIYLHLIGPFQIQDTIQNVNISFVIFQTIRDNWVMNRFFVLPEYQLPSHVNLKEISNTPKIIHYDINASIFMVFFWVK